MGIELKNWKDELDRVASGRKLDPNTPLPPSDEEVSDLLGSFRDAVLYLYNNTFRACGLAVGDRQSENNSMKLYDVLCRDMDRTIGDELAEARKGELEKLEVELAKKEAEVNELVKKIASLRKTL